MVCKIKNGVMPFVAYPEREEYIADTKTPVCCPICDKEWVHGWNCLYIIDRSADGFCSDVCRKSELPKDMCGHYACNVSGPSVTTMIPNPRHPKNQK